MGHFFGLCIAFKRNSTAGVNLLLFVRYRLRHTCFNGAGTNTVDGNALAAQLNGKRSSQTNDAVFGCGIGTTTLGCAQTFSGSDVDNTRIARLAQMRQRSSNGAMRGSEEYG